MNRYHGIQNRSQNEILLSDVVTANAYQEAVFQEVLHHQSKVHHDDDQHQEIAESEETGRYSRFMTQAGGLAPGMQGCHMSIFSLGLLRLLLDLLRIVRGRLGGGFAERTICLGCIRPSDVY